MNAFFRWLQQGREPSASPRAEYGDMARLWDEAKAKELPGPPSSEAAWRRLERAMDAAHPEARPIFFRFKPVLGGVFAAALALLFWMALPGRDGRELVTGRGEKREIQLADGTSVALNAETHLEWDKSFARENRDVFLRGEASFSVLPGAQPFRVQTEVATVEVVGTQFNVYARDEWLEVTVSEGTVQVSAKRGGELRRVTLSVGQVATCTADGFPSSARSLSFEGYPGWRQGLLMVDQAPLARVCREIERRFNLTIQLADPSLGQQEVTGLFQGDTPEDMVAALCVLLNREYEVLNDTIVIR